MSQDKKTDDDGAPPGIFNLTPEDSLDPDALDDASVDAWDPNDIPEGPLDPELRSDLQEALGGAQNLPVGILAGVLVGIVAAMIWATLSVVTGFQLGIVAVGVGAAVGLAVATAGRGLDLVFGIAGAVIAGLSVLLGNALTLLGLIAEYEEIPLMDLLLVMDYTELPAGMLESADIMDLVFYAGAIWAGFKFGRHDPHGE